MYCNIRWTEKSSGPYTDVLNVRTQPRYSRASTATLPPISVERSWSPEETDTLTSRTVKKMCELIRKSCTDEKVRSIAQHIKDHFAFPCGSKDPAALAWGVFWWVKHSVKFRTDESTLFLVGNDTQQEQMLDYLIAPEVLVRMENPSEDCDGFTMLTAALLAVLGVPVVIATVAADSDDRSRWSHVFLCAIINGRVLPLDTSHGPAPGWMVPKERIYRFQTWTLDGEPADLKVPSYQGLHGYIRAAVPRAGMGAVGYRRVPVRVPLVLVRKGNGFRGLGQACATSVCDDMDESGTCQDWNDSSCDTGNIDLNQLAGGGTTISPVTDSSGNTIIPLAPPASVDNPGGLTTSAFAAQAGMCVDPGGVLTECTGGATPGSTLTSSPACPQGFILSGTATGGTYQCMGTGASAGQTVSPNYATLAGQIASTVGADVKAVIQQPQNLLAAQTWANLVGYLPIIGIAVLGVVVITSFAGKK